MKLKKCKTKFFLCLGSHFFLAKCFFACRPGLMMTLTRKSGKLGIPVLECLFCRLLSALLFLLPPLPLYGGGIEKPRERQGCYILRLHKGKKARNTFLSDRYVYQYILYFVLFSMSF